MTDASIHGFAQSPLARARAVAPAAVAALLLPWLGFSAQLIGIGSAAFCSSGAVSFLLFITLGAPEDAIRTTIWIEQGEIHIRTPGMFGLSASLHRFPIATTTLVWRESIREPTHRDLDILVDSQLALTVPGLWAEEASIASLDGLLDDARSERA